MRWIEACPPPMYRHTGDWDKAPQTFLSPGTAVEGGLSIDDVVKMCKKIKETGKYIMRNICLRKRKMLVQPQLALLYMNPNSQPRTLPPPPR